MIPYVELSLNIIGAYATILSGGASNREMTKHNRN